LSAERLQKVLANAGFASRRECEELISAGRVAVNGKVVRILGARVDPTQDEIAVDGQPIGRPSPRTYVLLHKPAGVISTADDPQGRPTVVEMVDLPVRLFPVGRLDYDSEGLLLLTDDGELAQRLTHPSYHVEKEYHALLDQAPTPDALREWRTGVLLDGAPTAPAWVEVLERDQDGAWVRVVLHEGRKRQIRAVAGQLGYQVLRLIRVREGTLTLGELPVGRWRQLAEAEVEALWEHVGGRDSAPLHDEDAQPRQRPSGAPAARRAAPDEARARGERPPPSADEERRPRPRTGDRERPPVQRSDAPPRPPVQRADAPPRRDDQRDSRPSDRREPRRDDFREPRRDDRPGERRDSFRPARRDDRPGERRDSFRPAQRDDRPGQDRRPDAERGPRRDDRPGERRDSFRPTRRDDRPGERRDSFRPARRDDRPGERRDSFRPARRDEPPVQERGPARDERFNGPRDRPRVEPGNERPPEVSERQEKRGPSREWHARQVQEERERKTPPRGRGASARWGNRNGASRPSGTFRPRPPRPPKDKDDES
jgi:23S rRNA pseudouridine2605 synthase